MPEAVAIIDIGSNSIKALVSNPTGTLYEAVKGTRLGSGIGTEQMKITPEAMDKGVVAVQNLLDKIKTYHPKSITIVATCAIREASNGPEFCQKVKDTTGIEVETLSGKDEALLIARGVATDPHLKGHSDFCLFDLGGGSLECIHFQDNKIIHVESLPLGSIRMTEQFIADTNQAVSQEALQEIIDHVEEKIHGFPTRGIPLVGMGGGLVTTRNLLNCEGFINIGELRTLMNKLASMTLEERLADPHIPRFRADILPAAIATVCAIADKGGAKEIIHSSYNLRFGIANKMLEQ